MGSLVITSINMLRNVSERLDALWHMAHYAQHHLQRLLALLLLGMSLPALAAITAVTVSAPANKSVFTAPATITLRATASAATGYTVQKVEFFDGATNLIGSDTTKAYSVSWANVAADTYSVTARVTAVRANLTFRVAAKCDVVRQTKSTIAHLHYRRLGVGSRCASVFGFLALPLLDVGQFRQARQSRFDAGFTC